MNTILNDPKLYDALLQIDKELATETKGKGCPHCGGVLHSAKYPRKLKESCLPTDKKEIKRISFCCSTDGCRSRITPRSVLFMGRRRYMSVTMILYSAMCHGMTQKRMAALGKLTGVSARTLTRWQTWWQKVFLNSQFWQYNKAFIMPPLNSIQLCCELVQRFSASYEITGMINLLQFLSPLSSTNTSKVQTN